MNNKMAQPERKLRLAVLVSGGGTNLQAMIDRSLAGSLNAEIVVVVSDRPEAFGLERARKKGIPAFCVDYRSYLKMDASQCSTAALPIVMDELDRKQNIVHSLDSAERRVRLTKLVLAEHELIRIIDSYSPDYICLAGFMRLVTPYMIGHFNAGAWRVLNIHPALLPSFPGQHGYADTFAYGCKWGGTTVHFVDEGEDTGPVIAQAVYPIWPEDNIDKVIARGLQIEYEVYSQVINWLAQGHVQIETPPGSRPRVRVTDPRYHDILKNWALKGLGN
jgi:phosphoribosylglycinamide formyltransferase-1